ncbi:hypothetical protein [Catellatospora citrea]|uniref:Uncharacterized protein n=1 Tax=Catellatospora citrea TaxID=53366 RepID=A0A8J3KLB3_9ACTN|nr:hypothetical protein [Catellatospora citrea]RKE07879.1 hypothetical protein C8E86_2718 [Catellatospora citrea]GIG02113.1 hypothetical protein Cci01nite_72060 [Catellatospora citrea]
MQHRVVRSGWQNAMLACCAALMALGGVCAVSTLLRTDSGLRLAVGATAAVIWAAGSSLLAVRAARQGVRAEPGVLVAHGVLSTRRIPVADLVGVEVIEAANGRGGRYFMPVLVHRSPPKPARRELLRAVGMPGEPRHAVRQLTGLSAMTEQGAQRYADRIRAMAAQAAQLQLRESP